MIRRHCRSRHHPANIFAERKHNISAAVLKNPADIIVAQSKVADKYARNGHSHHNREMDETAVELGIWLSGLESFLSAKHRFDLRSGNQAPEASREFYLTYAALERCLVLCSQMQALPSEGANSDVKPGEVTELARTLRRLGLIGRCMKRAEPISTSEWNAWREMLVYSLNGLPLVQKTTWCAERAGESFLPEPLLSFSRDSKELTIDQAELALVLPRFGKVLRWLSVIGKMLEADEPLKPALVILARVNELAQELVGYLNNRLERFPDKAGEIFASMDGASYLASIEIKKVYTQELAGLISVRPSPTVYSGMETAYSVLNESFQQILASMARLIDPAVDPSTLFPSFTQNLERSVALRRELWNLVRLTQAAETNPDKRRINSLNESLSEFMNGPLKYLFYKDTETVERFVEEIAVAKQERDLVPTLHRFGAYLETLFRQVNMRSVLEQHPFEPPA
jgi:hypothetical protein